MMRVFLPVLLLGALIVGGCGGSEPCQPSPAYTVPAHWTHGYYSSEQHQNFWTGKWYTVRVYHQAEYVPQQRVAAVRCPTKHA